MANVESAAPVIDFEALLTPISESNPSGEPQQYTGLYDEIREARRADDNLDQGAWQTGLKVADYREVISLSVPALTSQTKDLQICVWLTEALTKQNGFVGLRDSLRLIREIEENFWDTFYPEIDEGDMEGRANAIEWLDKFVSIAVKTVPITSGVGYSFLDWDESTRFDVPENIDTVEYEQQQKYRELRIQAEQENRKTGDMWRSAKATTNRAFYEQLNFTLEECWTELNGVDRVHEEKFDQNQMPAVRNLKKALDDIRTQITRLLEEKRLLEPDDEQEEAVEQTTGEDGEIITVRTGPGVATGAIQSRQDAIKRLSDISSFFRKSEPHSPISYLIDRAVKWGNMPLEGWLADVISDEAVVSQIKQTLGFDTGNQDSSQSESE